MATFVKAYQFVEDRFKGVHNFTSDTSCTLRVAFVAAANAPNQATTTVLADLTLASSAFASTTEITGVTAEHTTGTVTLTANDLTITATGGDIGPFRYVIIYNDDPTAPADPVLGWFDYGQDVTITDGNDFVIDFTTAAIITAN